MSQVLTVPTHFNDLGELSEGFLDRVEQDTLILYGPVPYEEGSEIEFSVLLSDGSPALEGLGRVRAAVDGGADRMPETRYDVVVEALELDGRYEVVFERLVLARQAVSDHPPVDGEENAAPTGHMDAVQESDGDPVVEEAHVAIEEVVSVAPDEVHSLAPDEVAPSTTPPEDSAPDTVPPEARDDDAHDAYDPDDEDDEEPSTVVAAVDPQAILAASDELSPDAQAELEANAGASDEPGPVEEAYEEAVTSGRLEIDSEYAFEHGIAAEPQVGMPVPIPSMAAPPDAPPAPPRLRLAEPPQGLTRPTFARAEEPVFTTDGEISDVHTTGLFAYEDALPIPARPPFPDPDGPKRAAPVEAAGNYDVEESEPPQDDGYEEIRLSDFAETAEEG